MTTHQTIPQNSCPACTSAARRQTPTVNRYDGIDWHHFRCRSCGHRYCDPMPTDDTLARMYAADYFADDGAWVCGYWKGSYIANETLLRKEARDALAEIPWRRSPEAPTIRPLSGTMLEIGPAGGYFLDEARKAGYTVTGVELNAEMAEFGRETLGLNIHCGAFEAIDLSAHSFDVIVAQDVLEHTRDPRAFMRRVAELLAPGALFFIRGPLEDALKEKLYQAARLALHRGPRVVTAAPFHLQGFTRQSFAYTVAASGLAVRTFRAGAHWPPPSFRSAKHALASVIEVAAYWGDRVRGGGDFMTGVAS